MQQTLHLWESVEVSREMGIHVRGWLQWLLRCVDRRQQRKQLLRLDERMLKDIGISRADAMNEARKPFWKG